MIIHNQNNIFYPHVARADKDDDDLARRLSSVCLRPKVGQSGSAKILMIWKQTLILINCFFINIHTVLTSKELICLIEQILACSVQRPNWWICCALAWCLSSRSILITKNLRFWVRLFAINTHFSHYRMMFYCWIEYEP